MNQRFHGSLSPLGAATSLLVLLFGFTSDTWLPVALAGPVVVGLVLLVVAGRPRHLGTGLLVGVLTYPLVIAMILLASGAANL